MGKPMRNRILSIVLAISMIAVVFAALPTRAAVDLTGSVTTTDLTGHVKSVFVRSGTPADWVGVNVQTLFDGVSTNESVYVALMTTDLFPVTLTSFTDVSGTPNPATGWYNTSTAVAGHVHTLSTNFGFSGDATVYDVVARVPNAAGVEIGRTSIVVRNPGLTLNPAPSMLPYWPGETITATLVLTPADAAEVFYVQIVNSTNKDVPGFNYTGQAAANGYWTKTITFSETFPDGSFTIAARAQADNHVIYHVHFAVQKYEFVVQSDRDTYLPGEVAKISYLVLDLSTLMRDTAVTITYTTQWHNSTMNATTWYNHTATLDPTLDLWELTIPSNIALWSDVEITMWANATGDRSAEDHMTLDIGLISETVQTDDTSYRPGETVRVSVHVEVGGDDLPGANVAISVFRNGTNLLSIYSVANLTTDLQGNVEYLFTLVPESTDGNYIVNATASKLGFSTQKEDIFSVFSSGEILVKFDHEYYFGGDTATVSFQPIWNDAVVSVSSIGYLVMISSGILQQGNTSAGQIQVSIPAGYFGGLNVEAFAHVNSQTIMGFNGVTVNFALIGLTPADDHYRPGDTVTWSYTVKTGSQAGTTLLYTIEDENGVKIASGTPSGGSFSYLVPTSPAMVSGHYAATLQMTSGAGGFASVDSTVFLVGEFELKLSVDKSPYASGFFAPGQKITIHYEIGSYVMAQKSVYRLDISVDFDPVRMSVIVNEPSGDISYTIPDDAPSAPHIVSATLWDPLTDTMLSGGVTAFSVNNRESGWDRSVGGLGAGNMIILILIIIVIIMLIVVPYLSRRMASPKAPEKMEEPEPSEPSKTPPSP